MLVWAEVKRHFAHDGAWRDILVPDTSTDDWTRLLDFVRTGPWKYKYLVDDKEHALPHSVEELADKGRGLLTIGVLASGLNCHFWTDGDIELDFIPTELIGQNDLDALNEFCSRLALAMNKRVLVTQENCPDEIVLTYGTDGRVEYVGEGLSHG